MGATGDCDWNHRLAIDSVVYGYPEELSFVLEALGSEMPADPHTSWNGITAECLLFLSKASAVIEAKLGTSRIAPAQHIDRLQPPGLVDGQVQFCSFSVRAEPGMRLSRIRLGPRDIIADEA